MKKIGKIGCLGVLGVFGLIIVIAIIAAFAGGGSDTTDTASTEKSVETAAPAKKEKAKEKATGIGTALDVGDVTFTVNGKETAATVGPSIMPETASGKYVILDVTFKNNGNEAIMVDSSFFKLKRGEKTYETDSMASISANQKEDGSIQNSLFMEEINPDSEIQGRVVFDVAPDVADATDLQLQVQSGLFGTETGIITLK